jgi:hypothetical protein
MPNHPPIANAGPDTLWSVDKVFVLDATASTDEDGDVLSFHWSFIDVPTASPLTDDDITDADSAIASFLPHHFGGFRLRLTVSDGLVTSTDLLSVSAKENVPPMPDAGADIQAEVGEIVFLSAQASGDPDGDTLDYSWRFLQTPEDSTLTDIDVSGRDSEEAFFVPDATGTYEIELEADDEYFVAQDSILIQVEAEGFGCQIGPVTSPHWFLFVLLFGLLRSRRVLNP